MDTLDLYLLYVTSSICIICFAMVCAFPRFEEENVFALKSFLLDEAGHEITVEEIKKTLLLAVYYAKPDYEIFRDHQARKYGEEQR